LDRAPLWHPVTVHEPGQGRRRLIQTEPDGAPVTVPLNTTETVNLPDIPSTYPLVAKKYPGCVYPEQARPRERPGRSPPCPGPVDGDRRSAQRCGGGDLAPGAAPAAGTARSRRVDAAGDTPAPNPLPPARAGAPDVLPGPKAVLVSWATCDAQLSASVPTPLAASSANVTVTYGVAGAGSVILRSVTARVGRARAGTPRCAAGPGAGPGGSPAPWQAAHAHSPLPAHPHPPTLVRAGKKARKKATGVATTYTNDYSSLKAGGATAPSYSSPLLHHVLLTGARARALCGGAEAPVQRRASAGRPQTAPLLLLPPSSSWIGTRPQGRHQLHVHNRGRRRRRHEPRLLVQGAPGGAPRACVLGRGGAWSVGAGVG
jgi:hypothetical protein